MSFRCFKKNIELILNGFVVSCPAAGDKKHHILRKIDNNIFPFAEMFVTLQSCWAPANDVGGLR